MKNIQIERIFGLEFGSLSDEEVLNLPETQALLKLIETFPWLPEIAEAKFDPVEARRILMNEVAKIGVMDDRQTEEVQQEK